MKRGIRFFFLIIIVLLSAGCQEVVQEIVLNPDGSGKILYEVEVNLSDIDVESIRYLEKEELLRRVIKDMIELSEGIDAWEDVLCFYTQSGTVKFDGTAYFPDINKASIHSYTGMGDSIERSFTSNDKGEYVFELKAKEGSEINKFFGLRREYSNERVFEAMVEEARKRYLKMRSFLADYSFKTELVFLGTAEKSSNFVPLVYPKENRKNFRVSVDGVELVDGLDKKTLSKSWVRGEIQEKGGINFISLQELLFGDGQPLEVVISSDMRPVFDYALRVKRAKEKEQEMRKFLAEVEEKPKEVVETFEFPEAKILGVSLIKNCSAKISLCDEGHLNSQYKVYAAVSGPLKPVEFFKGQILRSETVEKEDLLLDGHGFKELKNLSLGQDDETVEFGFSLDFPGEKTAGIRRIIGEIDLKAFEDSQEIDLGITALQEGSKGTKYNAEIIILDEEDNEIVLKMDVPFEQVRSIKLFDQEGNQLNVSLEAYGYAKGKKVYLLSFDEEVLPQSIKIIAQVAKGLGKYKGVFQIEFVSLLGSPLPEDVVRKLKTEERILANKGVKITNLTKEEVIRIAKKYAEESGINLLDYAEPEARYGLRNKLWRVYFRMDPMLFGGWFDVTINDENAEVLELKKGR